MSTTSAVSDVVHRFASAVSDRTTCVAECDRQVLDLEPARLHAHEYDELARTGRAARPETPSSAKAARWGGSSRDALSGGVDGAVRNERDGTGWSERDGALRDKRAHLGPARRKVGRLVPRRPRWWGR
jgi:hypothetical protein